MTEALIDIEKVILSSKVKQLPNDPETEAAVLGALLIDKDAISIVKEYLTPSNFFEDEHRIIYETILEMHEEGVLTDTISLTQKLRAKNLLRKAGGVKFIVNLTNYVNSAANIEFHALILAQVGIKREMIKTASEIIEDGKNGEWDIFKLLDKTEQAFFKISERNIRKNYADAKSILKGTLSELELKKNNNVDGITGIPSGFKALDEITGGWQKSELAIVAARPGMGKTAFVVSAMRNAAIDHNAPVAIFSLEMSATQLMLRMISAEAELDGERLRKGILEPHEWQQLHHRVDSLNNANIFIDDTPALSILNLRAKSRRLKAQYNIQLIIIDYLQLMTGDDGTGISSSREQEIAAISRALKNLAKELDIPVIALSQLSRAVETRGGVKKPQLSDLRESGSIEQDADLVMFLYRDEYYKITQDADGNPTEGIGEVIIAKNRAGITDTVRLQFIGKFTKFVNLGEYNNTVPQNAFNQLSGLADFESRGPSQGLATIKSMINKQASDNPENPDSKEDNGEYPF